MSRLTQGAFSFLPDLSDEEIRAQVSYAIRQGWAVNLEHTDDPHPRNTYWEMWGLPLFDLEDPDAVMAQLAACRGAHPNDYVRLTAFDSSRGWETPRLSFIVQRPAQEASFRLVREEGRGRRIRYTLRTSAERPNGRADEAPRGTPAAD